MRTYLLDTSAFRALSLSTLETISQGARLLVSPFCVWELLTHLEDEGQFRRVKGNLMKFSQVQVLDDPQALVEREFVRQSDSVHEKLEDLELIYPMLAALRDSDSLSYFYRMQIRDSRSQVREITGCVARLREILGKEEQQFQEYLRKIIVAIRDGAVSVTTPAALHEGILDIVKGWWTQLSGRVNDSDEVPARFERREYVYSSYILNRALDYIECCATQVDPNDFEDAMFCKHLSLDSEITLVTSDLALQRCLTDTLALLNGLNNASWHARFKVCNQAEFEAASGNI